MPSKPTPNLSAIPGESVSMEEIYNLIMGEIEPELTTYILPFLDGWYQSETVEEKQDRVARYERAFEEFQRRFSQFMQAGRERVLAKGKWAAPEDLSVPEPITLA